MPTDPRHGHYRQMAATPAAPAQQADQAAAADAQKQEVLDAFVARFNDDTFDPMALPLSALQQMLAAAMTPPESPSAAATPPAPTTLSEARKAQLLAGRPAPRSPAITQSNYSAPVVRKIQTDVLAPDRKAKLLAATPAGQAAARKASR